MAIIALTFDPFDICEEEGKAVRCYAEERAAFREIDDLLKLSPEERPADPSRYVIKGELHRHFQGYRGIKDVAVQEVTPRSKVGQLFNSEVPDWLTNEWIMSWKLLEREPPSDHVLNDWPCTLSAWLVPGITDTGSLNRWFTAFASAEDFPRDFGLAPVFNWVVENFGAILRTTITSSELSSHLVGRLANAKSPVVFATEWIRRVAILPLTSHDSPLRHPAPPSDDAFDRTVARRLPLQFPLPKDMHREISQLFCRAMQAARLFNEMNFEAAVLSLNALWDGLADEIRTWLNISPRGMTAKAASHIRNLPGYESSALARQLVDSFAPPKDVPAWVRLDDAFDTWINGYARFIRTSFIRRDVIVQERDPARCFGRWLTENHNVMFTHGERSYFSIAQRIQKNLRSGRAVIAVLIDALAIQVLDHAIAHLNDHLKEQPTSATFVFAPIPSISRVSKHAVLTGSYPDSTGDLRGGLAHTYGLSPGQIVSAESWGDAERVRITEGTRLVVYRDNRLDDKLATVSSFHELLDDCASIFPRVSKLIGRLVGDFSSFLHTPPLVVLTADHGFTYGPSPGSETRTHRSLDGKHRCLEIADVPTKNELADETMAFLDKGKYHLRSHYFAALGRVFGQETLSNWFFSHGGLLPEEVVIPVVEWFGDKAAIPWPEITFPDQPYVDEKALVTQVLARNTGNVSIEGCSVAIGIAGSRESLRETIGKLSPGQERRLVLRVPFAHPAANDGIELDVTVTVRHGNSGQETSDRKRYQVRKKRRLSERTTEQTEFESMF